MYQVGFELFEWLYINLTRDSYPVVWWKFYNSPNASKWGNILPLVEPILALPLSNGTVEQCFFQTKLVKTNQRTALGVDNCLREKLERPALKDWNLAIAVRLWWSDKNRRTSVDTSTRKPRSLGMSKAEDQEDDVHFTCSDWEHWLDTSDI